DVAYEEIRRIVICVDAAIAQPTQRSDIARCRSPVVFKAGGSAAIADKVDDCGRQGTAPRQSGCIGNERDFASRRAQRNCSGGIDRWKVAPSAPTAFLYEVIAAGLNCADQERRLPCGTT